VPAQANISEVAPPSVDVGVAALGDPRIDGIMQSLETLGTLMGQQAQNQVAATIAAIITTIVAAVAVAVAAAAPAEVPPGNVVVERERGQCISSWSSS